MPSLGLNRNRNKKIIFDGAVDIVDENGYISIKKVAEVIKNITGLEDKPKTERKWNGAIDNVCCWWYSKNQTQTKPIYS